MPRSLPRVTNPDYESELDFDLLVSQRNELFRHVVEAGFKRDDFRWLATDGMFFGIEGEYVPMLEHIGSRAYCKFGFRDGSDYHSARFSQVERSSFFGEFFLQRSPGAVKARESLAWLDWPQVAEAFVEWLSFVRRETSEPDYWEVVPPLGILPATDPSAPNETFSSDELARVTASLNDVLSEVRNVAELSTAQSAALQETIVYLQESAKRLGRKDWLNGLIGAYLGWVVNTSMESQAAQAVFDFLGSKVSWLWSEVPKLLR